MKSLLIAASHDDAQAWQQRYPDRWSEVCCVTRNTPAILDGSRIDIADVTPEALAHQVVDAVIDVVENNIAKTIPAGARAGVGYLMRPRSTER